MNKFHTFLSTGVIKKIWWICKGLIEKKTHWFCWFDCMWLPLLLLLFISIVLPENPLFVLPDFSFRCSNVDEEAEWNESVGETVISGENEDEVWKTRCCGRESAFDFAADTEDVMMKEFPRVTLVVVKVGELLLLVSFDVDGFNAQMLLTKFIMWLRCFRLNQNKKFV